MTHSHHNLLGEPPATLLPGNPGADEALAAGTDPAEVGMADRVVRACEDLLSAGQSQAG